MVAVGRSLRSGSENPTAPASAVCVADGIVAPPDQVAELRLAPAVWVSPISTSVNDKLPETESGVAEFDVPASSLRACGDPESADSAGGSFAPLTVSVSM